MRFHKLQSIGNDFVLVEAQDLQDIEPSLLARDVCRRHFSIGADGLLVLDHTNFTLKMFNPDGTEDFCDNGLRSAFWYAHTKGYLADAAEIFHLDRMVAMSMDAADNISAQMGTANFSAAAVPHLLGVEWVDLPILLGDVPLELTVLSTGSAHAVTVVDELPDDDTFFRLSPLVENHPLFPERVSLMWVKAEAEDRLRLRIWERGAGETLGCGTGSLAAAFAWMRRQNRGGRIEVINPGGTVWVQADDHMSPATLTGRASVVYSGEIAPTPSLAHSSS